MSWELFLSIVGLCGTFGFGFLSLVQFISRRELQRALTAHVQAMFNDFYRIGSRAGAIQKANDLEEAKRIASGIDEATQTARHSVVPFSKVHARFVPYLEHAWEPKELPPTIWRRMSGGGWFAQKTTVKPSKD